MRTALRESSQITASRRQYDEAIKFAQSALDSTALAQLSCMINLLNAVLTL